MVILDVREPFEFEIARIDGAVLIPLGQLPDRLNELETNQEVIAVCKSGVRSAHAVQLLQQNGYKNIFNLAGGVDAWADQIDPDMQKY